MNESTGKNTWRYEPAIKHSSSLCLYGVAKIGGPWTRSMKGGSWTWSIFWWTRSWTWSTEGAHEPGVHVLYSPQNGIGSLCARKHFWDTEYYSLCWHLTLPLKYNRLINQAVKTLLQIVSECSSWNVSQGYFQYLLVESCLKQSQKKLMEGLQFPVRSKHSTCQREGNLKPQGILPIINDLYGEPPATQNR